MLGKPASTLCLIAAVVGVGAGGARAAVLAEYDAVAASSSLFQTYVDGSSQVEAQLFTLPTAAQVDSIEVQISRSFSVNTSEPITLELRATNPSANNNLNGYQPTGAVLGSQTVAAADISSSFIQFVSFAFSSPAQLDAGTVYGIVLDTDAASAGYSWYGTQPGGYADGNEVVETSSGGIWAQQPQSDLGFRVNGTFVPEPATLTLLAVGAGGLLLSRKRRGRCPM